MVALLFYSVEHKLMYGHLSRKNKDSSLFYERRGAVKWKDQGGGKATGILLGQNAFPKSTSQYAPGKKSSYNVGRENRFILVY